MLHDPTGDNTGAGCLYAGGILVAVILVLLVAAGVIIFAAFGPDAIMGILQ
jgi:hypothetical protein